MPSLLINDEVPENKEIIVLLHGLGRSNASMWLLASRLEDAGYYVQRVEYSSLYQKPDEILKASVHKLTNVAKNILKVFIS